MRARRGLSTQSQSGLNQNNLIQIGRQIMSDKAWKREEREVAKAFGTSRALRKGTKESDFQIDNYVEFGKADRL
jgi:hypothetical protein